MSHLGRRITNIFFAFVLAVMSVNLGGVLSLQSVYADSNKGTIKIAGTELDDDDTSNDPHLNGCDLHVRFFNYNEGNHAATVTFTAWNPTTHQLVSVTPSTHDAQNDTFSNSFTFAGDDTNGLNIDKVYTLAFGGTPQPQQGYHVKIDVTADGTKGNGTKSKVVWIEGCEPEKVKVSVPAAPATVDLCNPRGITDNVAWKGALPADTATIDWSQSQDGRTRTATLIGSNVAWSDNTTAPKVFALPADNGIECDTHVTPATPTKFDTCGTDLDTYTIPSKTGVDYYVDGSAAPTVAGTYPTSASSVSIIAMKQNGYVLDGTTSWTLTFPKSAACATPTEPTWNDVCLAKGADTFVIPQVAGATYYVKTIFGYKPISAGPHIALGTVTIKAIAENGAIYGPWSHTFTLEPCDITIDTEPSMHDRCSTEDDFYTIPTTEHVTYKKLAGYILFIPIYATIDAGEYPGTGTVAIIAVPELGYTINGDYKWKFEFDNTPCEKPVTPNVPTHEDNCGTRNDFYEIEATEGVVYTVNGDEVEGKNYVIDASTVTIVAQAAKGYTFGDKEYNWSFDFTDKACEPEPCTPSMVDKTQVLALTLQQAQSTTKTCTPGQGGAGGEEPKAPVVVTELPMTGPAEAGDAFAKVALIVAAGLTTYGAVFFAVNRRELLKK